MKGQRRAGFSLIEVLIAVGVLGIGILSLVAALAYGSRAGGYAGRLSEATGYGRELINLIRSQNIPFNSPINDAPSARVALDAPPFGGLLPSGTSFTRNIQMQRLKAATDGGSDDYRFDLYRVTVMIYWRERDVEKHVRLDALHRKP